MQIQHIWKAFAIHSTQRALNLAQTIQCAWRTFTLRYHLDRLILTKFHSLQTKTGFHAAFLFRNYGIGAWEPR